MRERGMRGKKWHGERGMREGIRRGGGRERVGDRFVIRGAVRPRGG